MQPDELLNIISELEPVFGIVKYVEKAKDGFEEATTQAYIRPESNIGSYEYEYLEDQEGGNWLEGQYVIVAEGDREKLDLLIKILRGNFAQVRAASRIAENIYEEETGQEYTKDQNLIKVLFVIRTIEDCTPC